MDKVFGIRATYDKLLKTWRSYPMLRDGSLHPLTAQALATGSQPALVVERVNALAAARFEGAEGIVSRETVSEQAM